MDANGIDLSAGLQAPKPAIDLSAGLQKPAATPAPQESSDDSAGGGAGKLLENTFEHSPADPGNVSGRILTGGLKSLSGLAGTVLDLGNRFNQKVQPEVVAQHPVLQKHLQDAATWLRSGSNPQGFLENVGAIGEQVLEYLGTDGLLKLVGGGAKVAEAANAGNKAMHATEQLDNAKQIATTLSKNPKLAGLLAIGLNASKDATSIGAQTYLHTEDPAQAAGAAATAGVLRTGGEGISAAGRWVQKVMPRTIEIGGVKIPVLTSQLNEHAQPIETGAAEAPKIAEAQQQQAPQVIASTAKDATRTALNRINQNRPQFAATDDASKMLPAPDGSEPFTFTLGPGAQPVEGVTGDLLQPAGKVNQPAAFPPKYTTAPGPKPIEGSEGTTGADISTAAPQEARADRVSEAGGGQLQTTNPQTAQSWMRKLEDLEQSSTFKNLPESQQRAVTEQREQLAEQLGIYHASPYSQRFEPIDVEGAADHVRTFGDAADQIQAAAKPIYAKLDQASGGGFDKWNKAAKQALRIMRSATSTDAYESAEAKFNEANGAINDLLTRHAGDVSREDYTAAKMAWRDSSRLDELHTVFERMMNGVTTEESDQGLTRVMTGRTKQLENYLAKGQNRDQIAQLIGEDGVTNMKRLTQLMAKANTARTGIGVLTNVFKELGRHTIHAGAAAAAGGWIAHMLDIPYWQGATTAAATTEAIQGLMRMAMTNPKVGGYVSYAIEHGVSPSVYAPLIARTIAAPFENPEPKTDDEGETE